MWDKVARFILNNKVSILIVILLITVFMGYIASTRLRLQYQVAKLMPDDDPVLVQYNEFKKTFGQDGNIMVVAIPSKQLFEVNTFNAWKDLADDLRGYSVEQKTFGKVEKLQAIDSVYSEANLYKLVADDSLKKFDFTPVIQSFPVKNQQELDSIKKELHQLPFYKGMIYSDTTINHLEDEVSLMMVFVNSDIFNSKLRGNLIERLTERIEEFENTFNTNVYVSGFPYIRVQVSNRIKGELGMFAGLAALMVTVILFLFFRNLRVVLSSLLVVGIGVVWAMGSIGLFDFEITGLLGLMPPLIIVIGVPNCVYLINKYQAEYKVDRDKRKALNKVITKIGSATFLTNLTTALGFATFIFTDSSILIEFGIIASINVLVVFILSILIIPNIFSFLPPPKDKHTKHLDRKWVLKIMDKLIDIVQYHRSKVYVVSLIIIVVGLYGISRMTVTGSFIDDIPSKDLLKTDLYFLEDNFNGLMPFEIMVKANGNGKITKLKNLKKIDQLQDSMATHSEFSRSMSLVDGIKFARQAFYGGNPNDYSLLRGSEQQFIEEYITGDETDSKAGKKMLESFVDSTETKARITVQVKDVGTNEMQKVLAKLEEQANQIFNPNKVELDSLKNALELATTETQIASIADYFKAKHKRLNRKIDKDLPVKEGIINAINDSYFDVILTGSSVVYLKGTNYLVKNLFTSLLLAIVIIAFMMSGLFKSIRMVIISILPNIVPLIVTASLMGYLGIPLKPSTILVFSIAFGISIDDTIHYLAKYRMELKNNKWNVGKSVILAIKETGVSMMYTSIILYFGFSIFLASDFGGTKALGMLVSITLLVAMFSNLVLLPCLLLTMEKKLTKKIFNDPSLDDFEQEPELEKDEMIINS